MERAIKISKDDKERRNGIDNAMSWLKCALHDNTNIKIVFAFIFEDVRVYKHNYGYYGWSFVSAAIQDWETYRVNQVKEEMFVGKYDKLIPCEVHVIVKDVECTYNIADFMLLENFLCPTLEPKS